MARPESQAIVPMIEEVVARPDALPMNLLVVDDEQYVRQLCADVAMQSGLKVTAASTAEEVISILENSAVGILMTDLTLPKSSGLDLLQRVHDQHREVAVIVLTQYGTSIPRWRPRGWGPSTTLPNRFAWKSCAPAWNAPSMPSSHNRKTGCCANNSEPGPASVG